LFVFEKSLVMADDLERGLMQISVAQICFSYLDDSLLRAKNALSKKRKMTWPVVAIGFVVFALFSWWAGIQIHAYYIYKAYGLTWFENQLPSVAEVSGTDRPCIVRALWLLCSAQFTV
jgi:apolipoprotein N-acyltransferase